uniref:HAT C-terminal dimerisation domain-containing protein n=1 Tax=Latimeria chalumnae TaxID=7897 RepID=H3AAR8_LATCH
MYRFKMKMLNRKEDCFFGFQAKQLMGKLLPEQKVKLKKDFITFYDSVLLYIDNWFDFSSDNVMMKLKPIGLYEKLSFSDIENVTEALKMNETINMDQLYEEFCTSRDVIETSRKDISKSVSEKWMDVFQKCGKENLKNLFQIVSFVLSVPGSNAFVERIFLMGNKWSDEWNRCSVDLIKSELQICINFQLSCKDFFISIQQDQELLSAAKSSKKYPWRIK